MAVYMPYADPTTCPCAQLTLSKVPRSHKHFSLVVEGLLPVTKLVNRASVARSWKVPCKSKCTQTVQTQQGPDYSSAGHHQCCAFGLNALDMTAALAYTSPERTAVQVFVGLIPVDPPGAPAAEVAASPPTSAANVADAADAEGAMLPLLPPLPARAPGGGARSAPLMTASEAPRLMAGSTPTTSNPVITQNPETLGACSDQARLLGRCGTFPFATSVRLLPGTNAALWSWCTIDTTRLQLLAGSAPATSNPVDNHTHRGP